MDARESVKHAVTGDGWAAGSAYEDFMGRWSRQLAPRFVAWLPVRPGGRWLDVGCGTGALTEAIRAGAAPTSIVACDPSASFIEFARARQSDPRISFVVAGAGDLPPCGEGYDSVTSSLCLNFIPSPDDAVQEMRRLAVRGGLVSACVWDYSDRMEFLKHFWDAAIAVDPGGAERDESRRFPICHPEPLEALFRGAGLQDVTCGPLEIPTRFSSFAECWTPFLAGTGAAPAYVASLDDDRRAALAAHFERSLPADEHGAIALVARAWAVRGVVP